MCDLVIQESFFLRDDSNPEKRVEIDVQQYLDSGVLELCELLNEGEIEMFVDLASTLDDGEAKSLAIALSRGLAVVTDDRKARRIFAEMGGDPANLLSTADLLKVWAEDTELDADTLRIALIQIQIRSRFTPPTTDSNHSWWQHSCK